MIKMYNYKHKGYYLQQTSNDWHYTITEIETNKCICHCPFGRKMTKEEAIKHIEKYMERQG